MGQIRIIGGRYRSRRLTFKNNITGLRPTPDRVRETLFNWLGQDLIGKKCLDLFAGSGGLGFEASSRGAAEVVMVDNQYEVIKALNTNKQLLQAHNAEIIYSDALAYLGACTRHFDILFFDPPYSNNLLSQCLRMLRERSSDPNNSFWVNKVYCEYQNLPDLEGYRVIKHGKAGIVYYGLFELVQ